MNESCHTYEWVMSHIWMSHVTHMNESCHEWIRHVGTHLNICAVLSELKCEWVMSYIWMSHVTNMNESCHVWTKHTPLHLHYPLRPTHCNNTLQQHTATTHCNNTLQQHTATTHCNNTLQQHTSALSTWTAYISHATHMNESCHTYEWVMSHIWMSHVTYEWGMPARTSTPALSSQSSSTSHVTHMNESCHTCEWVMSHIWMSHVTHMNEACRHALFVSCLFPHIFAHVSFTRLFSHISRSLLTHFLRPTSYVCGKGHFHTPLFYTSLSTYIFFFRLQTLSTFIKHCRHIFPGKDSLFPLLWI